MASATDLRLLKLLIVPPEFVMFHLFEHLPGQNIRLDRELLLKRKFINLVWLLRDCALSGGNGREGWGG